MSVLSIRALPREIALALQSEVRRTGKTKTEVVIDALRRAFGMTHTPTRTKALRKFFGRMSKADYKAFQEVTRDFSAIDESEWS